MPIEETPFGKAPLAPEYVKATVLKIAASQKFADSQELVTDNRQRALIMAFGYILGYISDSKIRDIQRHRLLKYFFDVTSSKSLTNAQAHALLRWMISRNSNYEPRTEARSEAVGILNMLDETEGQLRLL